MKDHMQIIIPLSGSGTRFIEAGYKDPKPLIKVHGMPIIEHVVNLFPGETDFLFVCRDEHLEKTDLENTLNRIAPEGRILSIPGHKLGPVGAVAQAFEHIDDERPTIVNYCDFYMNWDYSDFKSKVLKMGCDGAIPCYIGFHPHLLHEHNFYASCRCDENNMLQEIREKYSFTKNKMESPQSVGTYYFRSGKLVKKYFDLLMKRDVNLNGEYYVSLVYNLLCEDRLNTYVYNDVEHFCQWGTPQDLEEYLVWARMFDQWDNYYSRK